MPVDEFIIDYDFKVENHIKNTLTITLYYLLELMSFYLSVIYRASFNLTYYSNLLN